MFILPILPIINTRYSRLFMNTETELIKSGQMARCFGVQTSQVMNQLTYLIHWKNILKNQLDNKR